MSKSILILLLIFFILAPVIGINDHRLMPQELFLYLYLVLYLLRNKRIRLPRYSKFILCFFIAHLIVLTIVTLVSAVPFTKHDFYISRQILQLFIATLLFSNVLARITVNNQDELIKYIYISFFVLSIPSIIVFVQYYDVFGLQDVIVNLYKPVLFFIPWEIWKTYRATSVFNDSFTFCVYMVVLDSVIFYWIITRKLSSLKKALLIFLFLFNYFSQLFVSRTSLLFIPITILGIFPIILSNKKLVQRFILAGIVIVIGILAAYLMIDIENYEWALKILDVFTGDLSRISSVSDMFRMNRNFIEYLRGHMKLLLVPYHKYDVLYVENTFYADNFYFQEIVRYGIYGLLLYFTFSSLALIALYKKRSILFIITLVLMVINFKGGNTFFMPRNIYMYAFLISLFLSTARYYVFEIPPAYTNIAPNLESGDS